VLTPYAAILSRPGAKSREGEVPAIRTAVAQFYNDLRQIEAPGTLDGGDICEAGTHFFIGISHRTILKVPASWRCCLRRKDSLHPLWLSAKWIPSCI